MKPLVDPHTHSYASGHAYCTHHEIIAEAARKGIKVVGITDHGPNMPGGPHRYHFMNFLAIPKVVDDVRVIMGIEANILDPKGAIDADAQILEFVDLVIASIHWPCYNNNEGKLHTETFLNVMENPKIHIIGHMDDSKYPVDHEKVILTAFEKKVLLEINNSSLSQRSFRKDVSKNQKRILEVCKANNIPVILSSDAHFTSEVGNFDLALDLINKVGFPEELIINADPDKFLEFISK